MEERDGPPVVVGKTLALTSARIPKGLLLEIGEA
jgi:hypothetical protein